MAVHRNIEKEININNVYDTNNAFVICRGDTVHFKFTFKDGENTFAISNAKVARVFAKKIYRDGVHVNENPLFLKEVSIDSTIDYLYIEVDSTNTAGESGNYLLSVILLDDSGNTITAQSFPFELFNQGYAGVQNTPEDFRDEVIDAANSVVDLVDGFNKGDFVFNIGSQKVRAKIGIDEYNNPYWDMEVVK
jgi:hypothetical protein